MPDMDVVDIGVMVDVSVDRQGGCKDEDERGTFGLIQRR